MTNGAATSNAANVMPPNENAKKPAVGRRKNLAYIHSKYPPPYRSFHHRSLRSICSMASRQVFRQHRTDPRLAIGLDQAAGRLDFWCRPDPEPALMAASPEYDLALREMVSGHEAI